MATVLPLVTFVLELPIPCVGDWSGFPGGDGDGGDGDVQARSRLAG